MPYSFSLGFPTVIAQEIKFIDPINYRRVTNLGNTLGIVYGPKVNAVQIYIYTE